MKIKTSELQGAALDWAAAQCEKHMAAVHNTGRVFLIDRPWKDKTRIKWIAEWSPSRHWSQGGPILEREGLDILCEHAMRWAAVPARGVENYGPTPLIAAMRCYVASKLGDTVEVPEGLL